MPRTCARNKTFYVDVNAFWPPNLMILKADISKTSTGRYLFLFIFMCGNSKFTRIQKIKNFSGEVNWVHQALSIRQWSHDSPPCIGEFYPWSRRVPRVLACKITIEGIDNEAEAVCRN